MNRTTLLVLALIIVGVGGYLLMGQGDETPEPVAETIGNPDETAGTTAGAETDDAGEMTEAAGDMPAGADAAEETADIAEPVTDVAEDAAEAAGTDAMEGAADAEAEAAEEINGSAMAPPEESTEDVAEAGDETSDATPDVAIPDYLTVEGFDAERARNALDASEIGTVEKASLQAAISAAEDDPALRAEILERLRNVLGF